MFLFFLTCRKNLTVLNTRTTEKTWACDEYSQVTEGWGNFFFWLLIQVIPPKNSYCWVGTGAGRTAK
jgi:hypothetical protein